MAKLRNQRRYMNEVQAVLKRRLAASNEAAKAAEDWAKQLVETVDSLSKRLEDAMKDLKAASATLKASSRVPRRRMNYNKPSQWTLDTAVKKLTEYFTELFGPDWLNFDATGEGVERSPLTAARWHTPLRTSARFCKNTPRT
jgi:chromosome segregation ATPase